MLAIFAINNENYLVTLIKNILFTATSGNTTAIAIGYSTTTEIALMTNGRKNHAIPMMMVATRPTI